VRHFARNKAPYFGVGQFYNFTAQLNYGLIGRLTKENINIDNMNCSVSSECKNG
jgi:hypothetical protein